MKKLTFILLFIPWVCICQIQRGNTVLGGGSGASGNFMALDGSTPMTDDINLDGNGLDNAGSILFQSDNAFFLGSLSNRLNTAYIRSVVADLLTASSLGGNGDQMVTVNNSGNLEARDIPVSGTNSGYNLIEVTSDYEITSANIVDNNKRSFTYVSGSNSAVATLIDIGSNGDMITFGKIGNATHTLISQSPNVLEWDDGTTTASSLTDGATINGPTTCLKIGTNYWLCEGEYTVIDYINDFFPQDNAASSTDVNSIGAGTDTNPGISTVETTIVHDGSYAIDIESLGSAPNRRFITITGLTAGLESTVTFWAYEGNVNAFASAWVRSSDIQGNPGDTSITIDGAAWAEYNLVFTPANTSFTLEIGNGGSTLNLHSYWDLITVTQ